jgi:hypothetical protein
MNHLITECRFGFLIVNGREFKADLIITPKTIIPDWWRTEGHFLKLEYLPECEWDKISSVFIGTGFQGMMRVDKKVIEYFESRRITFIIQRTPVAAKEYNRHACIRKIGLFHLTC